MTQMEDHDAGRLIGVHHTSFTVGDMGRSLRFYRDTLGLTVIADWQPQEAYLGAITGYPGARLHIAYLQLAPYSEHVLELIQYLEPRGQPQADLSTNRPGVAHLCFQVDDLAAVYERLRRAGVPFRSPGPVPITGGPNRGGFAVYLRDPDGVTLELIQRVSSPTPSPSPSPADRGA